MSITSISHEEFQFNAKVLGFDIANDDNTYNAKVLQLYFKHFFNDNQLHPVPLDMTIRVNNDNERFGLPQYFISFPKDKLEVLGNFKMSKNITQVLPNKLICTGYFYAIHCVFNSLPNDCNFYADVALDYSPIKVLPDNLIINGDLDLRNCKNLQVLPNNLTVNGSLDISGTNIKSKPNCTKAYKIIKDYV